jgi:hypothetical protein
MASSVFFIKKKDRMLHLVQDYCMLNAMTMKNKYPLLLILELITKLREAKYFTKLDIRWGFDNVCMKEDNSGKPPSGPIALCLNHSSCSSASPTVRPPSRP